MKREEMLAKLAAGESPTNVCIDKYRDLYCKIQSGEKLENSDIGINTCALCYKHYALCGDGCSNSCPLFKTGDGCLDKEDSPYRILAGLLSDYEYNDVAWDKEKILTAIEGMIASLKKAQIYEKKQVTKEGYIKGEQECGLKVGDTVTVTRTAKYHEEGWGNSWIDDKMFAGTTGKITGIGSDDEEVESASGITVEIDGHEWGYPYFILEKVEQTYHPGQRFKHNDGETYILARLDCDTVNLVDLEDGNRYTTPIDVKDSIEITEEEMIQLIGKYQWKNFKLIEVKENE